MDPTEPASTAAAGAKYKLMSPAKLPIFRSPCITIPPGLSPSSFLDSPVLLTNFKVEPSPTTGSFTKLPMTHDSSSSAIYPMTTMACSNANASDEGNSNYFEFKPYVGPNMVPADMNHRKDEQSCELQVQGQPQPFTAPPMTKSEINVISNDSSRSTQMDPVASGAAVPDIDGDDFNHSLNTNTRAQAAQSDPKGSGSPVVSDRISDDGYNWRKYGQKHVKGSEFPRSYYKCTHPNCEVKKLFERSHNGQITDIVYKGTHDHPKLQPSRRYSAGASVKDGPDKPSPLTGQDDRSCSIYTQTVHSIEPNGTPERLAANDSNTEGAGTTLPCKNPDELDDDDIILKRRKMELGGFEACPMVRPIREPRVVVQTLSEVDILDDGYRWRKYGQKVVRGNPNPRSYYKCTNVGCPVRKHVERASHDPKAVITTYEGKHNHDVPTAKSSSHDAAGPLRTAPLRYRLEDRDTVSLDLGVGIGENRSNEYRQQPLAPNGNFNFEVVQENSAPTYFNVHNRGMNQHGPRESLSESQSVDVVPLNHSSHPYPPSVGRILTGP
ncbi:probable WRKY transcription factor 20 isoform X1 [Cucurbita moschata]|uniref:Probable WRKY transcription factor 20 isoform X1 n=1 Tax=Cucurbita moschata TaxID=3662 RepID=A0A6J1EWF5_CUCMO|nr:probable WRKY transcription factor 20 isoform X1 [Cucurbita moschata]